MKFIVIIGHDGTDEHVAKTSDKIAVSREDDGAAEGIRGDSGDTVAELVVARELWKEAALVAQVVQGAAVVYCKKHEIARHWLSFGSVPGYHMLAEPCHKGTG